MAVQVAAATPCSLYILLVVAIILLSVPMEVWLLAAVPVKGIHSSVNAYGAIVRIATEKEQLFVTPMLQHLEWTIL